MDFFLNDDELMIQEVVRDFAQSELKPNAAILDKEHRMDLGNLKKMAGLGFMGMNISETYGGAEVGVVPYSLGMIEVARACAATAVTMSVTNMVAEVICAFGNEAQKKKYVPRICNGEYSAGAFGLTESMAGSDPGGMRATAVKEGDHYRLNGSKIFITSAEYAGVFVVWMVTDKDASRSQRISAFLVEKGTPGFSVSKAEEKMGQCGSCTNEIVFDDCLIPAVNLLGEEGFGLKIAFMALDGGRIGIASLALGIGLEAIDYAAEYAKEREQFGRPIATFQGLQWRFADTYTELEAARLLVMQAAFLKQKKKPFTTQASMAKLYASEAANRACYQAVQVLGGNGYTAEYPVERLYRDVRVTTIYEGTSEIQRLVIAQQILGRLWFSQGENLMFTKATVERVAERHQEWEKLLAKSLAKAPERLERFSTISDEVIKNIYTPEDISELDYDKDLGFPGQFPYTRGVQASMHRGRLWTMRQFAGMGGAEETNARFHYLMGHGETGLSTAFDMPTLMGYDSDSSMSLGEVGKCGVAIDTIDDMEILFEGIPMDQVTTSMTINPPAAIMLAMYIATAEKKGISRDKIGGTIQNDMLKEFIAQKTFMLPPEPSMRIITDTVEFCTQEVPRWNSISISGYHIREAGSTAVQELAFTLADGLGYVQACIDRGLDIDDFAPRLSFFFNAHVDFFEEIAKYRAARRMWARFMRDRFGAKNPKSWLLRFHTQTAGCSLTAQQPYNNVVRTSFQALSSVIGGTQSLHTNSLDETLSLPTEHAVTIALRTQQIIGEEIGVTNTIDPLAGSYFIESLTNDMESKALDYIQKIDDMGGILKAIDVGYPQKEIADAAYNYQRQVDQGEKTIVGVNKYQMEETLKVDLLTIDPVVEKRQVDRLTKIKESRDAAKVEACLKAIETASRGTDNLMPHLIEAVKAHVSVQEICDCWRKVYGRYTDPGMF